MERQRRVFIVFSGCVGQNRLGRGVTRLRGMATRISRFWRQDRHAFQFIPISLRFPASGSDRVPSLGTTGKNCRNRLADSDVTRVLRILEQSVPAALARVDCL
jgi:hypothetical protein